MRLAVARVFVRFRPLCRVRAAVSFQQLTQGRAGVDLRCVGFFVTQDDLDRRQVGTVFVHQCRHCMAKDVACARFIDTCRLDVAA